jgi:monofunctional biosynthetic peptidoglycan transglycosylase
MLPAPKYFERRPTSPYLSRRTATILARMNAAQLP